MTRYTAFILVALMALPAAAQLSRAFEMQGLDRDDMRMALDAAETLYAGDDPAVGDAATWANEATGTQGRVDVTAFDGRCVTMMHGILPGDGAAPFQGQARRCRAEDGRWLIPAE